MSWNQRELIDLVATLLVTPPDAPTLCEGWETRHLAAHLYLRRHCPWKLGRLDELAELSLNQRHYERVIEAFARPVPALHPLALMDRQLGDTVNLLEYVIHHEDVLRGGEGDGVADAVADRRKLPQPMSEAVLTGAARFAKLRLRRLDVGLTLELPDGPGRVIRRGENMVRIIGAAPDLALAASGRRRAANLELHGDPVAVAAVETALAE